MLVGDWGMYFFWILRNGQGSNGRLESSESFSTNRPDIHPRKLIWNLSKDPGRGNHQFQFPSYFLWWLWWWLDLFNRPDWLVDDCQEKYLCNFKYCMVFMAGIDMVDYWNDFIIQMRLAISCLQPVRKHLWKRCRCLWRMWYSQFQQDFLDNCSEFTGSINQKRMGHHLHIYIYTVYKAPVQYI